MTGRIATVAALVALGVVFSAQPVGADPDRTRAAAYCPVAAHRGDHSGDATEDGLRAMRLALSEDVEVVEMDVRTTSDNRLLLMHDATVDRTTDGTGAVASMTARQLRSLRLNDGSHPPSLTQVVRAARGQQATLLVELKAMGSTASYRRLTRLARRYAAVSMVFQSRSRQILARVRRRLPGLRTAIISDDALTPRQIRPNRGIVVDESVVTHTWLRTLGHLAVYVFTPDTHVLWRRFVGRVDGLVTDRPRQLLSYRARSSACRHFLR